MKFPAGGHSFTDVEKRKKWLEKKYAIRFDYPKESAPEDYQGLIENQVNHISLPMSVAGPLCIEGTYAQGEFYVPLCTLEGTLTYSMMRGFKVTSHSGGIKTYHVKQELSRSPIFIFKDLYFIENFVQWVNQHFHTLKSIAEATTRHGKLLRIDPYFVQNRVILDCVYYTGEAAGQNMVTFATQAILNYMRSQAIPGLMNCLIESNFNGDKNYSHRNLMLGRGHSVNASALISNKMLKRFLRVDAECLHKDFINAYLGSALAGTSPNLHIANALAAIYLATGQDMACVAENALGIMSYEQQEEGLYVCLTMPSMTIGTVGGACRLPTQENNLRLLGCQGPHSSKKLAEIICAATLALEISLMGAISSHEFSQAHLNYGRAIKNKSLETVE